MNWLMYIGGGWIFIGLFGGLIQAIGENKEIENPSKICLLLIWIWICWRFIR